MQNKITSTRQKKTFIIYLSAIFGYIKGMEIKKN